MEERAKIREGATAGTAAPVGSTEIKIPEGVEYSLLIQEGNSASRTPGIGPMKIRVSVLGK